MKLLVCIKQVPDMESKFKVEAEGLWYDRHDLAWRMNEYDEYGVEQAVQLKEQTGADLTVLCIGPEQVKETMKKALAMGCDRAVHIVDDEAHLKDPFEIASMIAEFAGDKGFDLIFTGMQSQDRGSAQVGVMLAELLASAGRGVGKPENIALVAGLAKVLGGEYGSSRPVVDSLWVEHNRQVGTTGLTVSPKLYVACGISGAVQHLAGMKKSEFVVAINTDKDAPIGDMADVFAVADLKQLLPVLTEKLQAL